MTGMVLSAALLLLAGLIWSAGKTGSAARPVVWLGALIPAIVITACLGAALVEHRFGQVRLTLEALRLEQAGATLSVGGATGDLGDDLLISDAAPAIAELRLTQGEDGRAIELAPAAPTAGTGAVSAVSVNGTFVSTQPFGRGAAICFEVCETPDARWSVLAPSGPLRFVPGVRTAAGLIEPAADAEPLGAPLPVRQAFLGLPALRGWRPAQGAQPLRRHLSAVAPEAHSVLIQTGASGPSLDPQAWLGRRWALVVLDPGVWIAPRGEAPRAVEAEPARVLSPGDSVAFWDVRFGEPGAANQPAGRLQERRSFTVRAASEDALELALDTPATLSVADCSRGGLVRRNGELAFPLLGGRMADALDLGLPSRCENLAGHSFNFDPEALGGVAPRLLLTTFAPPLLLICAIAGLWAVVVCLAQGKDWGARPIHWVLYCVFQALLGLRLLTAIGGVAADPDLTTSPIIGQALLAYVACPALFLFLRPGPGGGTGWALGPMLFTGATVAAVWLVTGGLPSGLPMAAALGVFVLGAAGLMLRGRWDGAAASGDAQTPWEPSSGGWKTLLGAAVGGRLLLGLFSIKERVPGLGVAVSALYTPVLIVGFARLMADALKADPQARFRRGVAFGLFVILTLALAPLLIKDNGYVIVALPIALMAAWGAWTVGRRDGADWKTRLTWIAPGAGLVILLAGLLFGGALNLAASDRPAEIAAAASAADDAEALRILETVADESNNRLRIWQRLAPDRVAESGAGEAENLRVIAHYLTDYTSTWFGRGYLHPQRLGVLTQVQMNDNAAAVHLMGPFGRVSAWALLVLLALAPLTALRLNPAPDRDRTWPEIAGALSLWVLFGVSAYMVLANLQMVPFTGRNFYLLAPASDSDLLEGFTLIVMGYLGLVSRSAAPGWFAALRSFLPVRRATS